MPRTFQPYQKKFRSFSFLKFYQPVRNITPEIPLLESRGDRPLKMTFDDQLKMLVFFHLEEHVSARHMLQVLDRMTSLVKTSPRKMALRKAASLRPSTQGGLSSSKLYLKNSDAKPPVYCPIDTLNSATWSPLMVH